MLIVVTTKLIHLHTFAGNKSIFPGPVSITMKDNTFHTFHIPVMGLGFTIDTPLKVARFGISSVVSIIEDDLIEEMRAFHCRENKMEYTFIPKTSADARAKRISAYLNLLHTIVCNQMIRIKDEAFEQGSDITRYFELLPGDSTIKNEYLKMVSCTDETEKFGLQNQLRNYLVPGAIDVNIMAKADRINYSTDGQPLPRDCSDALAALRGFANSNLNSSIVLSAGYNPVLYSYFENFADFYPDDKGYLKKKIILKVSDYRSAVTQGKLLAKKGLWITEYRIESGLNCGGHAFATEGKLLGPIMEEFKQNKEELRRELLTLCNKRLEETKRFLLGQNTSIRISAQGGIGTSDEHQFLLNYYGTDSTGWGSPFLLVPEVTNVDEQTLKKLSSAEKEDYYLSHSSPLGIPFHSFRKSSSESQRMERIEKGRPGSPCYKKYLSTNTEFTTQPICTASRQYQDLKIQQLKSLDLDKEEYVKEYSKVVEKDCLCEGLGASARIKYGVKSRHKLSAVAICPGPNLAYFTGIFRLHEMVDHIYGRIDLLSSSKRSHMFVNELRLYIDYLKSEINECNGKWNRIKIKYFQNFKQNLLEGIEYYEGLSQTISQTSKFLMQDFQDELNMLRNKIAGITLPILVDALKPD